MLKVNNQSSMVNRVWRQHTEYGRREVVMALECVWRTVSVYRQRWLVERLVWRKSVEKQRVSSLLSWTFEQAISHAKRVNPYSYNLHVRPGSYSFAHKIIDNALALIQKVFWLFNEKYTCEFNIGEHRIM